MKKATLSFLFSGVMALGLPLQTFAISSEGLPLPPSTRGGNIRAGTKDLSSTAPLPATIEESVDTGEVQDALDGFSAPMSVDGKMGSTFYPAPGGGISVDATVTRSATADFVAVNGYCDVGPFMTRDEVKAAQNAIVANIKLAVGSDGRVRKNGSPGVFPYYDPVTGRNSEKFSGNVSVLVRVVKIAASQRIADAVESAGCSMNWDVRLVETDQHVSSILDDLVRGINTRKTIFEKLLKRPLTQIVSASISTWADGYSTYDPETNTVDVTTTLSVVFSTDIAK